MPRIVTALALGLTSGFSSYERKEGCPELYSRGVLALDFLADGRIATAGRNGFAVISNADGSRSHSFSKAAAPVTAIGSTRDGAHVLVGTLVGGLQHCVGGEKQPVSFMRVNPKTNEERAVERHRAHLAALDMELPQLETSLREGQISLEEVNAQLPEADARAAALRAPPRTPAAAAAAPPPGTRRQSLVARPALAA